MIQEPTSEPGSSPGDESDVTCPPDKGPTQPGITCPPDRVPAPQPPVVSVKNVLQVRYSGTYTISIDEQGRVKLLAPGQAAVLLEPEEAFDLLDLLFAYRNLLAAHSAEVAEQSCRSSYK